MVNLSIPVRSAPSLSKETHPVPMHDVLHIRVAVSTLAQKGWHVLQVRNRIQIVRHLFRPEPAVEVGTDRRVMGVSRKLADSINVIDIVRE